MPISVSADLQKELRLYLIQLMSANPETCRVLAPFNISLTADDSAVHLTPIGCALTAAYELVPDLFQVKILRKIQVEGYNPVVLLSRECPHCILTSLFGLSREEFEFLLDPPDSEENFAQTITLLRQNLHLN